MTTSRPRPLNALLTLLLLLATWPAAPLHAAPTKADTLYNRAAADVQEHINTLRSLKTLYGHTDAIRNRIDAMHTEAADALAAAAADYRDAGDRLESQEDAIYAEGLKASEEFNRKYQAAMQENPVDYEAIAAAQRELDARRAELDARRQTARKAYEATVEAIADVLDGLSASLGARLPALEADGQRAEEIRQALAQYENAWAAATDAQRTSEAGRALDNAAGAARQGITVWTDDTDYDALAHALAEALKAFLDYVTAIGAAPATPAVRADVYDTAGRLRLKNATAAEATRTLPRGVYIMQRQKLVVR